MKSCLVAAVAVVVVPVPVLEQAVVALVAAAVPVLVQAAVMVEAQLPHAPHHCHDHDRHARPSPWLQLVSVPGPVQPPS